MVQGIQVNLPEASSKALPVKNNEPLIVSIQKNGALFLESDSTRDASLTLEDLKNKAKKIFEANPDLQVVIRGDGEVKYERVMTVMAELQNAGASDIGLISQPNKVE